MQTTDVLEKERLIQTKQKHYSEMISLESAPTDVHKALYVRLSKTVIAWLWMFSPWLWR
jgi:hypothetical protein